MEFRILGPLEVLAAGGEPLSLGSAQQRAVLALLVIHAPELVSRDRVVDELWGERPPATAEHTVQVYVSSIRKHLRAGGVEIVVRGSAAGYVLELEPERVDGRRFERLVEEAQRALAQDPSRARGLFEQAVELWRGTPLSGLHQFEFAAREADRLGEVHATAVEGLVETCLALGEQADVIGQITALVASEPLREHPRRLLMVALYRSGRHAEALAAYRDAVAALDEIGLQPSHELRQLEEAILRHDPSLRGLDRAAEKLLEVTSVNVGTSASDTPAAAGTADAAAVTAVERPVGSAKRRKVVTALFCDVTGSTALGEELDPETLHGVMNRYWRAVRSVIERHGGTVDKVAGDAVMAVFGIPTVREDDALRAVRAAAEIRDRLPAVADEAGLALDFRSGVNTGLVLVGEGENLAIGDAVNVAARLEQAAAPGEILIGEETLRLVRDAVEVKPLEPLALKGKSALVPAFRLVGVDPLAPGLKRHLDAPLVGRERELDGLLAAWRRTVDQSACHLFTLLGAAGVGKSRLVAELFARVRDAAVVLSGRCLHYGAGITFWPLNEALTGVGDPAEEVLELLRSGGAATPEELFLKVRRLLESLALDRPVIGHIDDLQWAEPMLLDLLDHITDLSRGMPILLLCVARPELLEDRPGWGGGKLNATTVLLEPLIALDCELLLDHLGDGLPPDARGRVIAASDGNPLFLEEMAALARERDTVSIPSTIQALLAARLDGLPSEERELLECAAIEGEVVHSSAVQALAGGVVTSATEARFTGLVRKELIRPHPPTLPGDESFRFRHLLIRDAAYDALPKSNRAELHQQFATWLENRGAELAELDEITGWHLEQTARYQAELGRATDPGVALRAAEHLHNAGLRAAARNDPAAARNLLERAQALAPEDDALRARIGADLAEQLIEAGEMARADELLATAEKHPDTSVHAALIRFHWLNFAQRERLGASIESSLPSILEHLSRAGDERGLSKAHMAAFWNDWQSGRATEAGKHALLAAEHARKAGDAGLRSHAVAWYVSALVHGPCDAKAIAEILDEIEREEPGVYLTARVLRARSELARLGGRLSEARALLEQVKESEGALRMTLMVAISDWYLAEIELTAGDAAKALRLLLRADATLLERGARTTRAAIQSHLARVYELLGQHDAANAAIALSEQLGGEDDPIECAVTHAVRGRLALAEGDTAAAERWARSAVEHAWRTDFVAERGYARSELARILASLGRKQEARDEAHAALDLYEAKGDRLGAADARALLDTLVNGP